MALYRISDPARQDLVAILALSSERWGTVVQERYSALLTAAIRKVAREPLGILTKDRDDLIPGVRSLHVRHVRLRPAVKHPVHVVFYRPAGKAIEIVRVLHERMEPAFHILRT